jgi:pimeloyl-ACP methyl ester carboxylesterase
MAIAAIQGLDIAYELVGDEGQPWVITPGGRFSKDDPGLREMAEDLAAAGNRALIWDRPNTGASSVCFDGDSESTMQADVLADLIRHLDLGPTIIAGGSGGARVSLLAAARHPDIAERLAVWWMSGGTFGLLTLGVHYCRGSLLAAWNGGMEAVAELDEWSEVMARNPSNRERFLALDPREFIETLERWMVAYCPCGHELIPGLPDEDARDFAVPTLVFRSGASDPNHPRATSEQLADLLPTAQLVEPPWGDTEWLERQKARNAGDGGLFSRWRLLVPTLLEWADGPVPG